MGEGVSLSFPRNGFLVAAIIGGFNLPDYQTVEGDSLQVSLVGSNGYGGLSTRVWHLQKWVSPFYLLQKVNADVGRFLQKCGVAINGAVTSFVEAKIAAAVVDYGVVATAIVFEAVVDYVADRFLLPSGFRSFIKFTSKYGAGNHAPWAVLRGLVPIVFGDVQIWAFRQLCQPDQSNNDKEIADNIGNGLQELLVFHAPGGGTGPSLDHRNLNHRSVGYGVKSILSA